MNWERAVHNTHTRTQPNSAFLLYCHCMCITTYFHANNVLVAIVTKRPVLCSSLHRSKWPVWCLPSPWAMLRRLSMFDLLLSSTTSLSCHWKSGCRHPLLPMATASTQLGRELKVSGWVWRSLSVHKCWSDLHMSQFTLATDVRTPCLLTLSSHLLPSSPPNSCGVGRSCSQWTHVHPPPPH